MQKARNQVTVPKKWLALDIGYHCLPSGMLFEHPLLADYDWYWRLDVDSYYPVAFSWDPFRMMVDRGCMYAFHSVSPYRSDTA